MRSMAHAIPLLLLLWAGCLSRSIAPVTAQFSSWHQRFHDARSSSFVPLTPDGQRLALNCQPTPSWRVDPVEVATIAASHDEQAIVDGDNVYLVFNKHWLRSVSLQSGKTKWQIIAPASATFGSNPSLDANQGILYVYSGEDVNELHAFSSENGEHLWTKAFDPKWLALESPLVYPSSSASSAPLVISSTYRDHLDGGCKIWAFQSSETEQNSVWSYSRPYADYLGERPSLPAVGVKGEVYVLFSVDDQSTLVALHPQNGTEIWTVTLNDSYPEDVRVIVREDGVIVVAGFVISPQGEVLGDTGDLMPLAVTDTAMYGLYQRAEVVSRVTFDNHVQWSRTLGGPVHGLTVDGPHVVYASTIHDPTSLSLSIYALNAQTGTILWRHAFSVSEAVIGGVVVAGDGSVLVNAGLEMHRMIRCSGHGLCPEPGSESQTKGRCLCDSGYFAANCSVTCSTEKCARAFPNKDAQVHCSGEGECVCNAGYFPANKCNVYCNTSQCAKTRSNHAHCSNLGQCVCDDRYFGPSCEVQCVHGTVNTTTDRCDCLPGYYGRDCGTYCRASDTCSGHGRCDKNGECVCQKNGFWDLSRYPSPHCADSWNFVPWLVVGSVVFGVAVLYCVYTAYKHSPRHPSLLAQESMANGKEGAGFFRSLADEDDETPLMPAGGAGVGAVVIATPHNQHQQQHQAHQPSFSLQSQSSLSALDPVDLLTSQASSPALSLSRQKSATMAYGSSSASTSTSTTTPRPIHRFASQSGPGLAPSPSFSASSASASSASSMSYQPQHSVPVSPSTPLQRPLSSHHIPPLSRTPSHSYSYHPDYPANQPLPVTPSPRLSFVQPGSMRLNNNNNGDMPPLTPSLTPAHPRASVSFSASTPHHQSYRTPHQQHNISTNPPVLRLDEAYEDEDEDSTTDEEDEGMEGEVDVEAMRQKQKQKYQQLVEQERQRLRIQSMLHPHPHRQPSHDQDQGAYQPPSLADVNQYQYQYDSNLSPRAQHIRQASRSVALSSTSSTSSSSSSSFSSHQQRPASSLSVSSSRPRPSSVFGSLNNSDSNSSNSISSPSSSSSSVSISVMQGVGPIELELTSPSLTTSSLSSSSSNVGPR